MHAILDPIDFLAQQSICKPLEDVLRSNFLFSWDLTSDPCNFIDVYCDSDMIIALNLEDPKANSLGLTVGRLDPTIGKLFVLVELSVVLDKIYYSLSSHCLT